MIKLVIDHSLHVGDIIRVRLAIDGSPTRLSRFFILVGDQFCADCIEKEGFDCLAVERGPSFDLAVEAIRHIKRGFHTLTIKPYLWFVKLSLQHVGHSGRWPEHPASASFLKRLLNNTWSMTAVIGVLVLVLAAALYRATKHLENFDEGERGT